MKKIVQLMGTGQRGVTSPNARYRAVEGQRIETEPACLTTMRLMDQSALVTLQIPTIVIQNLVQLMDSGETGTHGIAVTNHVAVDTKSETDHASSRLILHMVITVRSARNRKSLNVTHNRAQWTENSVIGLHGQVARTLVAEVSSFIPVNVCFQMA